MTTAAVGLGTAGRGRVRAVDRPGVGQEPRLADPARARGLEPQTPRLHPTPLPMPFSQLGLLALYGLQVLSLLVPAALVTCCWEMALETEAPLAWLFWGCLPAAWPGAAPARGQRGERKLYL